MWGGNISPSKGRLRAGATALLMATDPINREILRSMVDGGMVEMDGNVYKISAGGREGLFVAFVAERWLQSAPQGPLDLESNKAGAAIAALVASWSETLIHVLARGPQRFDELRSAVDGLGTRALRRYLAAMQEVGEVESHGSGKDTTYAVTDWLRAGIAPLTAAARNERRQQTEGAEPIDALDVEAIFHLSLPILELPKDVSGTCRLDVSLEDGQDSALTGVTAQIEEGRVVSCLAGLDEPADARAAGPVEDWLDTVIEPDAKRVSTSGDRRLASALLAGLHKNLFGIPVTRGGE